MKYQISPTSYLLKSIQKTKNTLVDKLLCYPEIEANFELFVECRDNEKQMLTIHWSLFDSERGSYIGNSNKTKNLFSFLLSVIDNKGLGYPAMSEIAADELMLILFKQEILCDANVYKYCKQIFAYRAVEFEPCDNQQRKAKRIVKISNFAHIEFKGDFALCANTIEKIEITIDDVLAGKERAAIFTQRDYSEPKDQALLCEQLLQLAKFMGIPPQPINNNLR
jgi:hypothetical protein